MGIRQRMASRKILLTGCSRHLLALSEAEGDLSRPVLYSSKSDAGSDGYRRCHCRRQLPTPNCQLPAFSPC